MSCRAAWNTFSTASSRSSAAKRRQVQPGGHGVDHSAFSCSPPKLHDAELGVVGALPHELGVDGDEGLGPQPVAQGVERSRCR